MHLTPTPLRFVQFKNLRQGKSRNKSLTVRQLAVWHGERSSPPWWEKSGRWRAYRQVWNSKRSIQKITKLCIITI